MSACNIILLLMVLQRVSNSVLSLRFDLESGHTKCISEDIQNNSMTIGKYSIVNPQEGHPLPPSHNLTLRVTFSYGKTNHYADHVESGQFSFLAVEAGDYMACFWAVDHNPPMMITVDFEWQTGVASKVWGNVGKKGSIDAIESQLKQLEEMVTPIHEEMFYFRKREK